MTGVRAKFSLERESFSLDVAFDAPGSGVTALFGPSGAGKTTMLRLIAGLERPSSGYLEVNGELWQDSERDVFTPPHERPAGYVFQDTRLFLHMTVRNNLMYGFVRTPPDKRVVAFDRTVELLGLSTLLDKYPGQLSGGQSQRVAIGRALLTSPRLLLLDEPVASLDEASKTEIFPYLEKLHNEMAMPVLYISHSIDEVSRLADYLVSVEDGRVKGEGPLMEIITSLDLPFAKEEGAGAVIEAVVAGHDDEFQLTYLDFPGGRISIAKNDLPVGSATRVRIVATNVAIALTEPENTSVLNVFRAKVTGLAEKGASQTLVKLDVNGVALLARITRKSKSALALEPGCECFAMVKSVAMVT